MEVPFPLYTNIHHINCGVSSGVSGKYFATLCKVSRLKKAYINFKNFN